MDSLKSLRVEAAFNLFAFCLMPDHLHLLLRLDRYQGNLGNLMRLFKARTTMNSWTLGHEGRLWQRRFHDHILRESESVGKYVDYTLDNPVRRNLVEHSEDYPYLGMPDPIDCD